MSHKTIVIAFETTDFETVAEIQACDAADLHGLSEAHRDTGMDVNLAGAQIQSGIVSITVTNPLDLDGIQHYFNRRIRRLL